MEFDVVDEKTAQQLKAVLQETVDRGRMSVAEASVVIVLTGILSALAKISKTLEGLSEGR